MAKVWLIRALSQENMVYVNREYSNNIAMHFCKLQQSCCFGTPVFYGIIIYFESNFESLIKIKAFGTLSIFFTAKEDQYHNQSVILNNKTFNG